jgi:hypothetical protein
LKWFPLELSKKMHFFVFENVPNTEDLYLSHLRELPDSQYICKSVFIVMLQLQEFQPLWPTFRPPPCDFHSSIQSQSGYLFWLSIFVFCHPLRNYLPGYFMLFLISNESIAYCSKKNQFPSPFILIYHKD